MSITEKLQTIVFALIFIGLLAFVFTKFFLWKRTEEERMKRASTMAAVERADREQKKETELKRYLQTKRIRAAIASADVGSDNEARLVRLLDDMNLSYREFKQAELGEMVTKRPRLAAMGVRLLEKEAQPQ